MTIALGVLASDGLVLAADTEVSDGYIKTEASKIRVSSQSTITAVLGSDSPSRSEPTAAVAIAGAGTAAHIASLTDALWEPCLSHSGAPDTNFTGEVGGHVAAFYKEHVVPFASYPPQDQPEVELLIGVTNRDIVGPQDRHRLFVTSKTTIRREGSHAAIGAGAPFAQTVLSRLHPRTGLDRWAATVLAAYVVFLAKESIPGCGKFTEIVQLRHGRRGYLRWLAIRDLETAFLRHRRLEALAFAYALSLDGPTPGATTALQSSFAEFRKVFQALDLRGAIEGLGDDE